MAIEQYRMMDTGAEVPNAYLRCVQVNIGVDSTVHLTFNIYWDEAARQLNLPPIEQLAFDLEGQDAFTFFSDDALLEIGCSPIERAYAYIKTLPGMEDGEDA